MMNRENGTLRKAAQPRPQAQLLKRASIGVSALFVAGMLAACGDNTAVGENQPTAAVDTLPTATIADAVGDPANATALAELGEGNTPEDIDSTPLSELTATTDETPMAEGTAMIGETPMAQGTATSGETPMGQESSGAGTMDNPLTVAEIMQDPALYEGQQVTVVGEAEQIFGSSAFKLDENSWLTAGIDNDLPVLGVDESVVAEDTWLYSQLMVTGTIRNYVQVDFERDFNWFLPNDEWTAEIEESDPVLVADSVQVVDPNTFDPGLGPTAGPIEGAPAGTLAVAEVTGDVAQYAGQEVTVQGEVQNVYYGDATATSGPGQALRLDDNSLLMGGIDNDLLVIGAATGTLTSVDEFGWDNTIVRVTGTVQEFSRADIESAIGYSLTDPIFDSWDGQPVLIADSIEAVGQQ